MAECGWIIMFRHALVLNVFKMAWLCDSISLYFEWLIMEMYDISSETQQGFLESDLQNDLQIIALSSEALMRHSDENNLNVARTLIVKLVPLIIQGVFMLIRDASFHTHAHTLRSLNHLISRTYMAFPRYCLTPTLTRRAVALKLLVHSHTNLLSHDSRSFTITLSACLHYIFIYSYIRISIYSYIHIFIIFYLFRF